MKKAKSKVKSKHLGLSSAIKQISVLTANIRGLTMPPLGQVITELKLLVDETDVGEDVLNLLLPEGAPHDTEGEVWDYKEILPTLPQRPTDDQRKLYTYELGGIIKDVVSFHNAFGGYILFGVADRGRNRIRGIDNVDFDCGDMNRRLKSYVGEIEIECHFARLDGPNGKALGLLYVPRRPSSATPVRFQKDGPQNLSGQRAFGKETYVRIRDECRPAANTSADWTFLHSDRSPLEKKSLRRPRSLPNNLPARDADLVEFVGRDDPLTKLREWITDPRSPIRLVTGIGGLGKTALAYKFAEEVSELGAGEVCQVVWLTAKAQTYSALRGKLVPTARVDFDDLGSLYRAILRAIKFELPMEDDEPDDQDLEERVIEGLSIEPSLIVVDDVDSLSPDDQRAVVTSLNNIAIRTVGRELPCSKFIVTSRIDQGLSANHSIKLTGLDRIPFDRFVENLCALFDIPVVYGDLLDRLHKDSSGSPLFAASILRLIKLGESVTAVIDTWSGQDGEDVRAFAFEREIERLKVSESRLLLAVILLGETSINDLASVLDMTPKAVRERVASLQAYHLVSAGSAGSSQNIIVAQNELVSITAILRKHLGGQAESVERACARAVQQVEGTSSTIGHAIRNITGLWKAGDFNEAALLARRLRSQFPKNADVACVYGACLLKASPADAAAADRELHQAKELGCQRPELLPYIVQAKRKLADWQGLLDVTSDLSTNGTSHDVPLDTYLDATRELIKIAEVRADWARATELAMSAVEKIHDKTERQKISPTYFQSLVSEKNRLADIAVRHQRRLTTSNGDALRVFECVSQLAESDVYLSDIIDQGVHALIVWWEDVENRPMIDRSASAILARHLRRLDRIERSIRSLRDPNQETLKRISDANHDLAHRGAAYAGR